jgi:hypothetical protein
MCMVDMVSMVFQPNLENNFLLNIRKTMLTMHQSTWSTWSFPTKYGNALSAND